MARASVSIVISTGDAWEQTHSCLNSLRPTLGVRDQVIVVDHESTGRTPGAMDRYPWVEVVRGEPGVTGAARARHGMLVFLDPAVRALEGAPARGAVGPRTNGAPGPQTAEGTEYVGRAAMRAFARTWCAAHRGQASPTEHLAGF